MIFTREGCHHSPQQDNGIDSQIGHLLDKAGRPKKRAPKKTGFTHQATDKMNRCNSSHANNSSFTDFFFQPRASRAGGGVRGGLAFLGAGSLGGVGQLAVGVEKKTCSGCTTDTPERAGGAGAPN